MSRRDGIGPEGAGGEYEGFSAYWEQSEQASVLRITGELDLSASAALRALLADEVQLAGPPIVLDLSEVPFIDSTCLGVLIAALRQAKASRGGLRLAAARPRVRRAFEIAALDDMFPLFDTVEAAAAAAAPR
ncbi:MAG TPA: STAS domain-containing protein [Acidimicrobiales bacterium]|nr:STAS domain-containing protein [Acidimicrobiales bacterium]